MPTTIFDQIANPPATRFLGLRFISWDPEKSIIRHEFQPRPELLNPAGFIQGGMLVAMLDETMGTAVVVKTNGELFASSIDINVSFLNPAKPENIFGVGEILQLGKSIAFLQAHLEDGFGNILARGTSSARLVRGIFKVPG